MLESGTLLTPREQALARRAFLKGIIAAGVVASAAGYRFRTAPVALAQPSGAVRPVERLITLKVNGMARRVDVLPHETLAYVLRYKLGLTGTKIGCDRAECGNCTVLIDDIPHYSCSVLAHSVRGREVTTIEGLAGPGGKLHPVQQAFIDELAPQCGFCTPGQIMSAVALLKRNPNPTREEAAAALSGNLCRCGAYVNYLNAVLRAAEVMRRA